ncbi:hypothetical protein D9M71_577920 [compost metagenome]
MADIIEHGALEQREQERLDLQVQRLAAPRSQKILTQAYRPQGVVVIGERCTEHGVEAPAKMPQGQPIAGQYPGDHGVDGHGAFQFIIAHQAEAVLAPGTGAFLANAQEGRIEMGHERTLDTLALSPQVAHCTLEIQLVGFVAGLAGKLE